MHNLAIISCTIFDKSIIELFFTLIFAEIFSYLIETGMHFRNDANRTGGTGK